MGTCSACNAALAPGAGWCPRCFAPAEIATPAYATSSAPALAPAWAPSPTTGQAPAPTRWAPPPPYEPTSSSRWTPPLPPPGRPVQPPQSHLGRRIGGAVVVLVVLWFAWGMYSRANFKARQLQAPATLGAYVTVTSAQLSAMELAVGSELRATKQVDHVAVATYGSASEPRFILAAASGRIKAEPDMLKKEAAGISAFQLSPTISEEQSVTIDGAAVRCITVDGRSRPDLAPLSWSSVVVCVHSAKGLVIEGFGMDISVSEASSLMAEAVVTL